MKRQEKIVMEDTPLDVFELGGFKVMVKREDLSCPSPGPENSKIRGVMSHLLKLKRGGSVTTVGVVSTRISRAGWIVSYCAKASGLGSVNFYPMLKEGPRPEYCLKSEACGGVQIGLKARRESFIYAEAKGVMKDRYGSRGVLLPKSLELEEARRDTIEEWERTKFRLLHEGGSLPGTIVVAVGSGTICSGLLRGVAGACDLIGVRIASWGGRHEWPGQLRRMQRKILKGAGFIPGGLWGGGGKFKLVTEGWEYTERCMVPMPFPSSPCYDAKAWDWLHHNIQTLKQPVLFWNIGT